MYLIIVLSIARRIFLLSKVYYYIVQPRFCSERILCKLNDFLLILLSCLCEVWSSLPLNFFDLFI